MAWTSRGIPIRDSLSLIVEILHKGGSNGLVDILLGALCLTSCLWVECKEISEDGGEERSLSTGSEDKVEERKVEEERGGGAERRGEK